MGFLDQLRGKYELYKLEQRYTRRDKRTTFYSDAQYVDGEYIYSPTTSTKSSSSFGSSNGASKRMSTIQVKEIFTGSGRDSRSWPALSSEAPHAPPSTISPLIRPFMHHQRGLVRVACTATNAYNPALALTSALLATNNEIVTNRGLQISSSDDARSSLGLQRRSFTVSHRARNDVEAIAKDQDAEQSKEGEEQQRKKGTFAGYEALMGTARSMGQEQQQNHTVEPGITRRSKAEPRVHIARGSNGRNAKGEMGDPNLGRPYKYRHNRRADKDAADDISHGHHIQSLVDESAAASGTSDWKEAMHRIGEQANILAQQKPKLSAEEFNEMKSKMDYEGMPFSLEQSPLIEQIPFPWAVASDDEAAGSALTRLIKEIELFAQHMQPTEAEKAARDSVMLRTTAFIDKGVGDHVQVSYFGSQRTGLSMPSSDLDLRLQPRKKSKTEYRQDDGLVLEKMTELVLAMKRHRGDWMVAILRNARYPIINVQHRHTGIDVQIVSSPSTKPQHDVTMQYLQLIPNLKTLFFVVKNIFTMRGLIDVFNGGTGSYGLLMMLVASLTRRGDQRIHSDLGTQLLQFLNFYCEHDYTQNGIAVTHLAKDTITQSKLFRKHGPSTIPRATFIRQAYARKDPVRAGQWSIGQARPFQPYLPCIQDPANPLNDLGRKMNAIKHIIATLRQVRDDLRASMERAEKGQLAEGESLLEPVVGRCHEVYLERRRRVKEHGQKVIASREGKLKARDKARAKAEEARVKSAEEKSARLLVQQEPVQEQQPQPQPIETAWAG